MGMGRARDWFTLRLLFKSLSMPSSAPSSPLPAQDPQRLQALSASYLRCSASGQWDQALQACQQALALVPGHAGIQGDVALCQMRLGHWQEARESYLRAVALDPNSANLWDGLTEVCGHMGLREEVRRFGARALALKDAQTAADPGRAVPAVRPLSEDRRRQVVAFSLFGARPRYCEAAILNVQAAAELLPRWVCRFYVDDTVPVAVVERLRAAGAEVVHLQASQVPDLSALMWRFLVLADPGVDRFLIRDADSVISSREQAAVQAWIDSGRAFHLMRDYFTHTELLLAGMWGGCNGAWPDVRTLMAQFLQSGNHLAARMVDQHFLRQHIWPTVRRSLLSHDPVFGFMDGQDFPPHAPHGQGDDFHVGCDLSAGGVGSESPQPEGSEVRWSLRDASGQVLAPYVSRVSGGRWYEPCPRPVLARVRQGEWRVQLD